MQMVDVPPWIRISPSVRHALEGDIPIVVLESALITHGLPRPVNLDLVLQMDAKIKSLDVEPAVVAFLQGQACLGLTLQELELLALASDVYKISRRDIGLARAKCFSGGTTVAATMRIAHASGLRVFATGGIGGVHRGDTGDISADLPDLAKVPIAVICSGAKAILDLPRTLELLETLAVPAIGWQIDEFPAFFSRSSGLPLDVRADSAAEVAEILHAHWETGGKGVLICIPCPQEAAMDRKTFESALKQAENEMHESDIHGKDITPFLLKRISELTNGESLHANLALLLQNASIAAQISKALHQLKSG
jgi:pseudouridine-5'-phosphate glycosidase